MSAQAGFMGAMWNPAGLPRGFAGALEDVGTSATGGGGGGGGSNDTVRAFPVSNSIRIFPNGLNRTFPRT